MVVCLYIGHDKKITLKRALRYRTVMWRIDVRMGRKWLFSLKSLVRWDTTASSLVNCKSRTVGVRLWRDIATHKSDIPRIPVGYRALRNAPSITTPVGLKCRGRQVVEMGIVGYRGPRGESEFRAGLMRTSP